MKKLFYILPIALLFSCSGKDEQFCKCLEAGDALNSYSVDLLEGDVDEKKANELKRLKEVKKEACADYQTMSGEEMLKRKNDCSTKK